MNDIELNILEDESLNFILGESTTLVSSDIVHINTTEGWNSQKDLIGRAKHIYVYSDFNNVDNNDIPAIKIGDGKTLLFNTPFVTVDNLATYIPMTQEESLDRISNEPRLISAKVLNNAIYSDDIPDVEVDSMMDI